MSVCASAGAVRIHGFSPSILCVSMARCGGLEWADDHGYLRENCVGIVVDFLREYFIENHPSSKSEYEKFIISNESCKLSRQTSINNISLKKQVDNRRIYSNERLEQ